MKIWCLFHQIRKKARTCKQKKGKKGQMSIFFLAFVAFFWALWPCRTATELTVNVSRNKTNPEIGKIRQSITGNSSTETVTIEFKEVSFRKI